MRERKKHQPPPAPRRRWGRGGSAEPSGSEIGPESGSAGEQERLILEALSDLRGRDVREVMTPRVDVVALTIPVHADDVATAVRQSGHSCFPVVGDDLDDLVGVLFVNDLFRTGWAVESESRTDPTPLDISRRLRTALVLPESLGVLEALTAMRRQRRAFAVVVDEYGGMAGVLTVKDLLEPLVGDLRDEFDGSDEAPAVRVDHNRWLLDGRASVDEIRDRLGMQIPEGEYVTLGGFLFDGFGHIPDEGETLQNGDWELKVVEMDKRRVAKVVARLRQRPGEDEGAGAGQGPPESERSASGGGDRPRPDQNPVGATRTRGASQPSADPTGSTGSPVRSAPDQGGPPHDGPAASARGGSD